MRRNNKNWSTAQFSKMALFQLPLTLSHHLRCYVLFILSFVSVFAPPVILGSKGFNLKLIPKHSPDSPLYQNLTSEERFEQMMYTTNARAQWLGATTASTQINTVQPVVLITKALYYVVEVDIGTPARRFYLMLDTGTALSWVQSNDCTQCFELKGGSFDYTHSRSFRLIDCIHPMCLSRSCQQEHYCLYHTRYGGGGSYGVIGSDILTFNSDGVGKESVRMYFGVGSWNNVIFGPDSGPENIIAGLFGLGNGTYSFPTQAMDHSLGRFSYCLPHFKSKMSGVLKFGTNADIPSDVEGVLTTPFVDGHPSVGLYYLDCSGISVDGIDIGLPPNTFKYDPVIQRGGMVIDTGSPVTAIFPSALKYLEDALDEYFDKFIVLNPWNGGEPFYSSYCYAKPSYFHQFPTITFHFRDADFVLEADNGFKIEEDYFCLAIGPLGFNGHASIFGGYAQTNNVVRYDMVNKKLSWYRKKC